MEEFRGVGRFSPQRTGAGSCLTENKIGHNHPMVAGAGCDGEGAHWREVVGGVEMVDAEDRESALEGIPPAGADAGEGIREIRCKLAMDDVRCGGVEIPA